MAPSCKVELIQASKCAATGTKIVTLVCEYPRAIHAQLLTHRVFSKNSSSSRAVPIKTAIQHIQDNPIHPIWTSNQSGMQGNRISDSNLLGHVHRLVSMHQSSAIALAELLGSPESEGGLNIHKQNVGRYLEPFQNIKIVLTATEWDNWDWLRLHSDAQPEIEELANAIKDARDNADYMELNPGDYHVPFVTRTKNPDTGVITYSIDGFTFMTPEQAVKTSMSVCAQTSYRKADHSPEKTATVHERLFGSDHIHASPAEHQATPIPDFNKNDGRSSLWPEGVTHMDRSYNYWSGNFRNWIQNRQLIPNHDKAKF